MCLEDKGPTPLQISKPSSGLVYSHLGLRTPKIQHTPQEDRGPARTGARDSWGPEVSLWGPASYQGVRRGCTTHSTVEERHSLSSTPTPGLPSYGGADRSPHFRSGFSRRSLDKQVTGAGWVNSGYPRA